MVQGGPAHLQPEGGSWPGKQRPLACPHRSSELKALRGRNPTQGLSLQRGEREMAVLGQAPADQRLGAEPDAAPRRPGPQTQAQCTVYLPDPNS